MVWRRLHDIDDLLPTHHSTSKNRQESVRNRPPGHPTERQQSARGVVVMGPVRGFKAGLLYTYPSGSSQHAALGLSPKRLFESRMSHAPGQYLLLLRHLGKSTPVADP